MSRSYKSIPLVSLGSAKDFQRKWNKKERQECKRILQQHAADPEGDYYYPEYKGRVAWELDSYGYYYSWEEFRDHHLEWELIYNKQGLTDPDEIVEKILWPWWMKRISK